ncbi:hypothetical protein EH223_05745 [candidate division KSB1 bacterium]|nr:hypothetical protein [candidate division KSB1 bacterium]RQW05105.1 MAG: hypothetical protein EH223_05745 [candidate division KSB1 bacterium]
MTRRLFMGWTVGLFSILVLLPHIAHSDIYMKQKQHIDAISAMGQNQPAQDLIVEIWITKTKMMTSNEKQKTVVDLEKQVVTFADHEKKTVTTMPLDFTQMVKNQEKEMSAEDQAAFQQFMGKMMDIKVSVKPTSEKKKIGKWECQKYIQTIEMAMGTMTSEIWATTDIKIDEQLYAKFNAALMAQMPGLSQNVNKIMEETQKIKGVHVLSKQTNEMMGQSFSSSTELIDFKEAAAPAGVFAMPSGYKSQNPF